METLEEIETKEQEALQILKTLVKEHEILKHTKEEHLLIFVLRARRCDPYQAFKTILTLLEYKDKKYPELYEKARPECIEHLLSKGIIGVVKRKELDEGPAALVLRTENWTPGEASTDELLLMGILYAYEVAKNSVEVQRQGIIIIIDVKGFGFSHARKCTYNSVMKVANCIIHASPFLISSCFVIHCPNMFDKLYQVVKFAIPEEYRSYVNITKKDLSSLHKLISPDKLPLSLGGQLPEEEGWETGLEDSMRSNKEDFVKLVDSFGEVKL